MADVSDDGLRLGGRLVGYVGNFDTASEAPIDRRPATTIRRSASASVVILSALWNSAILRHMLAGMVTDFRTAKSLSRFFINWCNNGIDLISNILQFVNIKYIFLTLNFMFKCPIPEKAPAQHIAIVGKTGSGKTHAAKACAEWPLQQKQRVCIIDPTSAWWGLRSDAKGTGPGFPVVVFGGEHADVSLTAHNGVAIAEIIGTTDISAVLDTRLMTVGERTRFFSDFGEALLRVNKGPLHLIIDEAHLFAPQGRVADPQSGKMLHAANNLVSLRRGIGLRIIMITQRPAKLHKDSLTQAETLIALRLIAPQDRRAVEDCFGEWAEPKQGAKLLASLPSLPTGSGWIWAPELGVLEQATFPRISTYDSGRAMAATEKSC